MATNEPRYRLAERRFWDSLGTVPEERVVRFGPDGTRLRVQEVGSGPPLVFVHGTSNAASSWAPLAVALPDFRCLLVDRPGCGLSEPISEPFDGIAGFQRFADRFVAEVLDALQLDRATVVATSFGAHLALRSAAATPARIERIVAYGHCFGAPMDTVPPVMRLASAGPLGRALVRLRPPRRAVPAMLRQIGLGGALAAGRVSEEFVDWFHSVLRDTDTLRNELDANPALITPVRGLNPDVVLDAALLAGLECPVWLLWGTDDPMGGADVARSFARLLPDAHLEVAESAGHAPWVDDPVRAAAVLGDAMRA